MVGGAFRGSVVIENQGRRSRPSQLIPGVRQTVGVVEDLMASGDSGRTWFPELVDELRASWRPDLSWAAIIDLRDRLQAMVEEIIVTRGIKRARVRCFH